MKGIEKPRRLPRIGATNKEEKDLGGFEEETWERISAAILAAWRIEWTGKTKRPKSVEGDFFIDHGELDVSSENYSQTKRESGNAWGYTGGRPHCEQSNQKTLTRENRKKD